MARTKRAGKVVASKKSQAKYEQEYNAIGQKLKALEQAELSLKNSQYKEELKSHVEMIRQERAKLDTLMKLADKEKAMVLQNRRTDEMLEMQDRLKRSQALLEQRYAKQATFKFADVAKKSASTDKRFDRLEQKLDKIAGLLEKMIEREKE